MAGVYWTPTDIKYTLNKYRPLFFYRFDENNYRSVHTVLAHKNK